MADYSKLTSSLSGDVAIHTGHFRETPAYRTIRPRGHPQWLLAYTISGAGRFASSGGDLAAGPGTLTLTQPGTFHDYGTAHGATHWELIWTHFHPRLHWGELLSWPRISEGLMQIDISGAPYEQQIIDKFWDIHRIWTGGRPRREMFALAGLEELLLWCSLVNPAGGEAPIDPRVAEAIDFICSNLAEDLCVRLIAERVFVSPSRLAHLFTQHCGVSVQQFVEDRRIERAKQHLSATSRSIQAIATDIGYASPFYFSLRFKKATGESPTEYRKRLIAEY